MIGIDLTLSEKEEIPVKPWALAGGTAARTAERTPAQACLHLPSETEPLPMGAPLWPVARWVGAIDPIRGFAALAVVIHHSWQQSHFAPGFFLGSGLGEWGVSLFFVLSGFCIHLPQAFKGFGQNRVEVNWRQFFFRRARRLLPTHYAALALSILAGFWIPTNLIRRPANGAVIAHIFMIHVWYQPYFWSINAVFWTIAIEVHFYLAYPIFLRLREKFGERLPVLMFAFGLSFYTAASFLLKGDYQFVFRHLFLCYWWEWALGAYLADVYVRGQSAFWMPMVRFRSSALAWGIASLVIGSFNPLIGLLHLQMWLAPVVCFLFLGAALLRPSWPHVPLLSYFGSFSYSLYLIHPVAIAIVLHLIGNYRGISSIMYFVGFSILISWLFFLLVERHFLSQRQTAHAVLRAQAADMPT